LVGIATNRFHKTKRLLRVTKISLSNQNLQVLTGR